MEIEKFKCELCLEDYNIYERKPYILVPCGHGACFICINNLERVECPFCREPFENKIVNWELNKRLPKPVIPIAFNLLQLKLNESSVKLYNDYIAATSEIFVPIGQIEKLIDRARNQTNTLDDGIIEKLVSYEIFLKDLRNKSIESGIEFNKNVDSLKKEILLDKNKYSDNNLLRLKREFLKAHNELKNKKEFVIECSEKWKLLLNSCSNLNQQNLTQLDNEIEDIKRNTVFTSMNNVVKITPIVITNIRPSSDITEQSLEQTDRIIITSSQKSKNILTAY